MVISDLLKWIISLIVLQGSLKTILDSTAPIKMNNIKQDYLLGTIPKLAN